MRVFALLKRSMICNFKFRETESALKTEVPNFQPNTDTVRIPWSCLPGIGENGVIRKETMDYLGGMS